MSCHWELTKVHTFEKKNYLAARFSEIKIKLAARFSVENALDFLQKIAEMSKTELAKFWHSLGETELTWHWQKVRPKFGRTESSVDHYSKVNTNIFQQALFGQNPQKHFCFEETCIEKVQSFVSKPVIAKRWQFDTLIWQMLGYRCVKKICSWSQSQKPDSKTSWLEICKYNWVFWTVHAINV